MINGTETRAFPKKQVSDLPATIYDYEQLGKQLSKTPNWKKCFYNAYKLKDYSLAGYIYFSKHYYRSDIMDVHQAYKYEKKLDVQISLLATVFVVIVTAILYLFLS